MSIEDRAKHCFKNECTLVTYYLVSRPTRTEGGHPERAFFQKFETFGLGQTNWAEILRGNSGISGQTISTILVL